MSGLNQREMIDRDTSPALCRILRTNNSYTKACIRTYVKTCAHTYTSGACNQSFNCIPYIFERYVYSRHKYIAYNNRLLRLVHKYILIHKYVRVMKIQGDKIACYARTSKIRNFSLSSSLRKARPCTSSSSPSSSSLPL